jgi:transcriptional regulator with XRE-family HTH domain
MSKKEEKPQNRSEKKGSIEDGIGSRIRASREARGYTQTHLAGQTKSIDPLGQGISRTAIVGYEAEHSKPGAREIKLLCNALNITPNWLLYGEESIYETQAKDAIVKLAIDDSTYIFQIAMALAALKQHERQSFSNLIFSMAGRELGHEKLEQLQVEAKKMAVNDLLTALENLQIAFGQ